MEEKQLKFIPRLKLCKNEIFIKAIADTYKKRAKYHLSLYISNNMS